MPAGLVTVAVYSKATGRLRRVYDIGVETDPVRALAHKAIVVGPGEAVHAHVSPGDSWEMEPEIQGEVSKATGMRPFHLHPHVDAVVRAKALAVALTHTVIHDRYVEIDSSGKIIGVHYADPSCGDTGPNGGTLVLHDDADERWTHVNGVFTAPVVKTKT